VFYPYEVFFLPFKGQVRHPHRYCRTEAPFQMVRFGSTLPRIVAPRIPQPLAGPADPRTQSAQDPGRPVWCNLPIVTLIAHSASWSRTLAALRPRPFQSPLPAPCCFLLRFGASLHIHSFHSLSSAFFFLFTVRRIFTRRFPFLDDVVPLRQLRDSPAASASPSSHHCDPAGGPPRPTSDPDARTVMTRERELPTLRR
jgi:hypothetical protein